MENFNEFKFTGNLVRAPWTGKTNPPKGEGRTVARFTVANNSNGNGNFVGFTAYGACAEAIAKLPVGTAVGLSGHIRESSVKQEGKYDDKGKAVYNNYKDLIVTRFAVLQRGGRDDSYDASDEFEGGMGTAVDPF